jgi:hypothetical protein
VARFGQNALCGGRAAMRAPETPETSRLGRQIPTRWPLQHRVMLSTVHATWFDKDIGCYTDTLYSPYTGQDRHSAVADGQEQEILVVEKAKGRGS